MENDHRRNPKQTGRIESLFATVVAFVFCGGGCAINNRSASGFLYRAMSCILVLNLTFGLSGKRMLQAAIWHIPGYWSAPL
jgi:hypothetical protein